MLAASRDERAIVVPPLFVSRVASRDLESRRGLLRKPLGHSAKLGPSPRSSLRFAGVVGWVRVLDCEWTVRIDLNHAMPGRCNSENTTSVPSPFGNARIGLCMAAPRLRHGDSIHFRSHDEVVLVQALDLL